MDLFELSKSFTFEAAHRLVGLPAGHKCARLHGHSFKATIIVRGKLRSQESWVMDYGEIKAVAKPIVDQLDHNYLNDIPGLENPTSEVLARWIYEQLKPRLQDLFQVVIAETCTTECRYPAHNTITHLSKD